MKRISLYVRTAFLALSLGAIAQGQGGPAPTPGVTRIKTASAT